MPTAEFARGTSILSIVRHVGLAPGTALLAAVLGATLSGTSGAERIGACHTAFMVAAIVALVGAAVALFARTGGRKSAAESG